MNSPGYTKSVNYAYIYIVLTLCFRFLSFNYPRHIPNRLGVAMYSLFFILIIWSPPMLKWLELASWNFYRTLPLHCKDVIIKLYSTHDSFNTALYCPILGSGHKPSISYKSLCPIYWLFSPIIVPKGVIKAFPTIKQHICVVLAFTKIEFWQWSYSKAKCKYAFKLSSICW